jgi:GNAT superfamily N-acetyltransferase
MEKKMSFQINLIETAQIGQQVVAALEAHSDDSNISKLTLKSLKNLFRGQKIVSADYKVFFAQDIKSGEIMGVCNFIQNDTEHRAVQIIDLFVAEKYRRVGVASALVEAVEASALEYAKKFNEPSWHVMSIASCSSLRFWLEKKNYLFMRRIETKVDQFLFDQMPYKIGDFDATQEFLAIRAHQLQTFDSCSLEASRCLLNPYCTDVYNGADGADAKTLPCVSLIKGGMLFSHQKIKKCSIYGDDDDN